MKKLLFSTLSLLLSLVFLLSGCGASTPLSFTNDFNGGGGSSSGIREGLTETIVYNVNYVQDYDSDFKKNPAITDELVSFRYENGKYETKFTALSTASSALPEQVKNSDVLSVLSEDSTKIIYHLSTKLEIDVIADVKDGKGEVANHDIVTSETYFLMEGHSFAPIYSTQSSKTTFFSLGQTMNITSSQDQYVVYDSQTVYSKDSYTVNKSATLYKKNEQPEVTYETPYTQKYSFKTVIDNGTLLFALRNVKVDAETSLSLPTVSTSYETPKTLSVKNYDEFTANYTVKYNDAQPVNSAVAIKKLGYTISEDKNKGSVQYVFVQTSANQDLPYRALVVEYVHPLTTYGSFYCMGALRYTIDSVTVA